MRGTGIYIKIYETSVYVKEETGRAELLIKSNSFLVMLLCVVLEDSDEILDRELLIMT